MSEPIIACRVQILETLFHFELNSLQALQVSVLLFSSNDISIKSTT